jgi:hypothetical protein
MLVICCMSLAAKLESIAPLPTGDPVFAEQAADEQEENLSDAALLRQE